jgi:hypothetical protein
VKTEKNMHQVRQSRFQHSSRVGFLYFFFSPFLLALD